MDIDHNSVESNAATAVGETVQPIQRAKRTYGSKTKPLLPQSDDKDSSNQQSLSAHSHSTADALYGSTSMSTAGVRPYDWAERLKEMDRSDDEESQDNVGATELRNKGNNRFHSSLSSPTSPTGATDAFGPPRQDDEFSAQKNQHSTNTSFASGTSAAVSSPASNQSLHVKNRLSRPLPPQHHESFLSDEEMSGGSTSPSVRHSEKLTGASRELTPENKLPNASRLLVPSVFKSPVKSFSHATKASKEKKPPRFLGDDSDDGDLPDLQDAKEAADHHRIDDPEDHWMTDGSSDMKKQREKDDYKKVKPKVKGPTKKEIIEADKETARIRAEKDLDVQEKALFEPLSFASHLKKRLEKDLKHPPKSGNVLKDIPIAPRNIFKSLGHPQRELEDPILNFSSSSPKPHGDRDIRPPERGVKHGPQEKDVRSELQRKKLLAMQRMSLDANDDSDLEIVPEATSKGPSSILSLNAPRKSNAKNSQIGFKDKKRSQQTGPGGLPLEMTKEEYNRILRQKATAQSMAVMEHKAADFQRRGGVITKRMQGSEARHTAKFEMMMKGAMAVQDIADAEPDTEEEEEDPSYDPQDEDQETLQATSPSKPKPTVLVANSSIFSEDAHSVLGTETFMEEENETALSEGQAPTSVHSDGSEQEDDDGPIRAIMRHRRAVVLSDEESLEESDGENVPPLTNSAFTQSTKDFGFDLLPSLTQTPFDATTPRTPLSELRLSESKAGRELLSGLPISPTEQFSPSQRKLKINLSDSFEPTPSKDVASLLPAFGESSPEKPARNLSSPFGFTQLFNETDDEKKLDDSRSVTSSVDFKPAKFGDINSQLFFTQLSPSQRASPSKRNRASLDKKDPLAGLRKQQDDDFLLTQAGPLGRIELSTQEVKELQKIDQEDADAALKDGEEERRKRRQEAEQDNEPRWINEAGLFTQTKPKDIPWSLSQNMLTQGTLFFPQFGELDAEQLLSQRSPAKSPVRSRRLVRKANMTGLPNLPSFEDSSPEKPNAFKLLMGDEKKPKNKDLPSRNEFVQGEAEESDDELVMGFSRRHREDEDEDGGVDPEEIAKLLDDKALSKDEIHETAVIEKHKEQLAEDDAENQKIHEAVINGQLRHKKRGHDWMDDDSSDDDLRARPSKYKKRKVAGIDQLDQLEDNPETRPFVDVYKKGLPGEESAGQDDEDNEFAYLNKVEDDVEGDADAEAEPDEEMESDNEDEWENRKVVTHAEIQRQLREKLENGENLVDEDDMMDADAYVQQHMPSSDGFLDGDYDNISQVPLMRRPVAKVVDPNDDKLFLSRSKLATVDPNEKQKLAAWAKQNEKSRDTSTRGTASAAVTGHSKAAVRSKSTTATASLSKAGELRKPVRSETVSSLNSRLNKKDALWE